MDAALPRILLLSRPKSIAAPPFPENSMYVSPRPPRPATRLAPARGGLIAVIAFALCSVLAMAGTVLLGECGVVTSQNHQGPAEMLSGP